MRVRTCAGRIIEAQEIRCEWLEKRNKLKLVVKQGNCRGVEEEFIAEEDTVLTLGKMEEILTHATLVGYIDLRDYYLIPINEAPKKEEKEAH